MQTAKALAVALITALGVVACDVERDVDSTTECQRALVVDIDSWQGGTVSCGPGDETRSWSFSAGAEISGLCAESSGTSMTLTLNGAGSIEVREESSNALFVVRFRLANGTELETAKLQLPTGGTVTLTVL